MEKLIKYLSYRSFYCSYKIKYVQITKPFDRFRSNLLNVCQSTGLRYMFRNNGFLPLKLVEMLNEIWQICCMQIGILCKPTLQIFHREVALTGVGINYYNIYARAKSKVLNNFNCSKIGEPSPFPGSIYSSRYTVPPI